MIVPDSTHYVQYDQPPPGERRENERAQAGGAISTSAAVSGYSSRLQPAATELMSCGAAIHLGLSGVFRHSLNVAIDGWV
jgi:hypothetical protein